MIHVPAGVSEPASSCVTVRCHLPASAAGGGGAAATFAVVVRCAVAPFVALARTVKRCRPGESHDVTSQFPSSPYVYGGLTSTQRTLPSIRKSTPLRRDAASVGWAVQWILCGSAVFPS